MKEESETEATKPGGGAHCVAWGTLEELLLACAVSKHGTADWNLIVSELQGKISSFVSITSQQCIDKFSELKRRFISQTDVDLAEALRNLRVEELRRALQRHDASIVLLEKRVKKLEEDRDRSLRNDGADSSPDKNVQLEKLGAGEDSDRSVNESNSTFQQKAQNAAVSEETLVRPEPENETELVQTGSGTREMQNWSHNGELGDDNEENNAENNQKMTALQTGEREENEKMKTKPNRLGDFGSGGLVSESNNYNNSYNNKQNASDVQSSVSLSLEKPKRRRIGGALVGSCSFEEPDEVSPARQLSVVQSQPLNNLLRRIRAHRLGHFFERRLRSQESESYKSLIRQHVDLRMVQSRLDNGFYSTCIHRFFRDLLLLFNNAVLFFRKNSPENLAAKELRALVRREMTLRLKNPNPQPGTSKAKPKFRPLSFFTNRAPIIVVCGTTALGGNLGKRVGKKGGEIGGKMESSSENVRKGKMGSVSGRRNKSAAKNNNGEIEHKYGANELSSHDGLEFILEREKNAARKKKGAANLLKTKQNPRSEVAENEGNNGDSSWENGSKDSKTKEEEEEKNGGESKQATEGVIRGRGGRGRKTTGRPPRKQEEASGGAGKRGGENGDSVVAEGGSSSSGRAKRRTRK